MPQDNTVVMEGVRIIFRNFAGKEGQYNREGDRNFAVVLDDKTADAMLQDGWNVKQLTPKEGYEEDGVTFYLPVAVNFSGRPPRIVMITSRNRITLDENLVEQLDWADITNVDLIVRPYNWEVSGKTGVKAYLQTMFVTIQEDYLEAKYGIEDGASE